jgi:hypothetical protein
MNAAGEAKQWNEVAAHLIQAHGARPGGLIGYAPTLEQLHFAHADTHLALASIGALPPDGHAHPLPINAGWHAVREGSYRPFQPSPQAREDAFDFPLPYQTGLPHTWTVPETAAALTRWAARQPFANLSANSKEIVSIKHAAAVAAAAWAARTSFPGPVQTRPPTQPDRGAPRQPEHRARHRSRGR